MKMRILIIITFISSLAYSQDPSFSQIDLNSMYMNPALCGSSGYLNFLLQEENNGKE